MEAIVSLKAFGDFVIAYSSARNFLRNNAENRLIMIAGAHHIPLYSAMECIEVDVVFLGKDYLADVPSFYDIRKNGLASALFSISKVRHELRQQLRGSRVLFDRIGLRERILAGVSNVYGLPASSKNIYHAYRDVFGLTCSVTSCDKYSTSSKFSKGVIIPSSRIQSKSIPSFVINEATSICYGYDLNLDILIFEDENLNVENHCRVVKIPRNFNCLADKLREYDFVLSADSLPAHLAEFFNVPIFVISPHSNKYWLPQSSFERDSCAVFDNLQPLNVWISSFF